MPLYEYQCDACHEIVEAFRSVADRNDAPECCGLRTKKLIGGCSIVGDLDPYWDENLEAHIKSRQHRKRVMREQGVSEAYGKGWT